MLLCAGAPLGDAGAGQRAGLGSARERRGEHEPLVDLALDAVEAKSSDSGGAANEAAVHHRVVEPEDLEYLG